MNRPTRCARFAGRPGNTIVLQMDGVRSRSSRGVQQCRHPLRERVRCWNRVRSDE
jgi:hypothetical protein